MRTPIVIGILLLPSLAAAQPRFRNVTAESGFLSLQGYGGHGIQVADVDGDGRLDVYVTHIFDPKQDRPDLLFRNLGGSPPRFEEIGPAAGVADDGFFPVTLEDGTVEEHSAESHAAVFADFDNDSDLDLFNAHTWNGQHRLYRNDGDARFVDVSDSAGIDPRDLGPRGVAAADLDGNGFLDVLVSSWAGHVPNVYLNQGGLRFERIRLPGDAHESFANQGISVVDVNRDREPDIALSAFEYVDAGAGSGPVALLASDSGRFVERTEFAGLAYEQTTSDYRGTNGFSFQDIDNDADLDVVVTGYHGSKLYRNNGEGRFNLVRRFEGLHYTASFGDVDLDGDLDLYFAGDAGIFLNDGSGEFASREEVGLEGIGTDARSAVFADMDGDGDLDLLIASKQGPNTFFVNDASPGGWLKVALTGPNGEMGAIGAAAALYRDESVVGYRVVQTATGYCSQDPSILHFGVDPARTYELRVTFKEGKSITRSGLSPGQVVQVDAR
jgi:hypothetical protein